VGHGPAPCCNSNKPGVFANGNINADDDDYGAQLRREVGASQLTRLVADKTDMYARTLPSTMLQY